MNSVLRLYAFIPLAGSQLIIREHVTRRAIRCLVAAVLDSQGLVEGAMIHIHVNGFHDDNALRALRERMRRCPIPVRVTVAAPEDKISAVNFGLEKARLWNANAYITVDNDVYFFPDQLTRMLGLFQLFARRTAIGCEKLPIVPRNATTFQRAFSAFAEFVVRSRILDNRKVSGSLYVVNPWHLESFPPGCLDGDYLTQIGVIHCNGYIYSEYPRDPHTEALRRQRLAAGAATTGFVRDFQDPSVVAGWIDNPSASRIITRFQAWAYFPAFAHVMLGSLPGHELLVDDISRRLGGGPPTSDSIGINLMPWVGPPSSPISLPANSTSLWVSGRRGRVSLPSTETSIARLSERTHRRCSRKEPSSVGA